MSKYIYPPKNVKEELVFLADLYDIIYIVYILYIFVYFVYMLKATQPN